MTIAQQQGPEQDVDQESKTTSWTHDFFVPLSMDDYLNGVDDEQFPVENYGDASFTGVWASAAAFLRWLETNRASWDSAATEPTPSQSKTSFHILELGSGTGFLGIHLAYNLNKQQQLLQKDDTTTLKIHYKVTLSDNPTTGAYHWTKANLEKALLPQASNKEKDPESQYHCETNEYYSEETKSSESISIESSEQEQQQEEKEDITFLHGLVEAIPLDWSCQEQRTNVAKQDWDMIVGTDLVYSEEGCHHLVTTMAELLQVGNRKILYGHTQGRIPELDQLLEDELDRWNLEWKTLDTISLPTWNGMRTTIIYEIQRRSPATTS